MNTTVRDIAAMPEFKGMKLLAGASGLDNVISRCGFLDYEYDAALREKYYHRSFEAGEFVFSSFLYAKDNEFYIIDAIKRLHQRGCSGLAIRNIFKLNIRENVLRFADAGRFPIFLLTDENFYFEDMSHMIFDRVKKAKSIDRQAHLLDQALFSPMNKSRESLAREINPSFQDEIAAVFFRPEEEPLSPEAYLAMMSREGISETLKLGDAAFYYRGGLMLIHSGDVWRQDSMYRNLRKYMKVFSQALPAKTRCGVSAIHHHVADLAPAAREAMYASALPLADSDGRCFYKDLGIFQFFISTVDNQGAIEFSDEILRPIEAYDNENNSSLYLTAKNFVLADGDLKAAARELSQHVNTIRYRLEAVGNIFGENVIGKKGYERLSAAVKTRVCREAALLIGF